MASVSHQFDKLQIRAEKASASLFVMNVAPNSNVFRYDVEITETYFDKTKKLTCRSADDGQKVLYRRLCDSIIRVIRERYNFGINNTADNTAYVYDGKKNLYLLHETPRATHSFVVQKSEIDPKLNMHLSSDVEVVIQQSKSFKLSLDDVSSALLKSVTDNLDNSLKTFFELLTSQSFYNQDNYDVVSSGIIFKSKVVAVTYMSTQLKNGFKKGVRFIKKKGEVVPAVVLDVVSSIFYPPITIFDLYSTYKRETASKTDSEFISFLRGVRGYLVHDPKRTVVFVRFSNEAMSNIKLEKRDKSGQMPFVEFYQQKKNHNIRDVRMFAVEVDSQKKQLYPPELFKILPYQRVPISKMNKTISNLLLSANSISSCVRHNEIMKSIQFLDNTYMARFGVTVNTREMVTDNALAKRLTLPPYQFANHTANPEGDRNEYRLDSRTKFFKGAIIDSWAVLYNLTNDRNISLLHNDVSKLIRLGNSCGMTIKAPKHFIQLTEESVLFKTLKSLKTNETIKFVLFCDSKIGKTHQVLKYAEVKLNLLTQHVSTEAFLNVKTLTLRNILMKMNMKNGGMNYLPNAPSPKGKNVNPLLDLTRVFVFSYDVSHPAPASTHEVTKLFRDDNRDVKSLDPSVVGFAANMAENPNNFIGDYFFQASRKESMDQIYLEEAFTYSLKKARANRTGFDPSIVIVIRDGISEGQYKMAIENELKTLRNAGIAFRKLCGKEKPTPLKFMFVVVNKRHGKRFFALEQNGRSERINNLNKSSAIDSVVVRPDAIKEFYLMSHTPIRGTAKVPQYALLLSDGPVPTEMLEEFLHIMCHTHQVSLGGVSIPAPVYLAHELAKRGHNNLAHARELKRQNPDAIKYNLNWTKDDERFKDLTKDLDYRRANVLNNWRFTA